MQTEADSVGAYSANANKMEQSASDCFFSCQQEDDAIALHDELDQGLLVPKSKIQGALHFTRSALSQTDPKLTRRAGSYELPEDPIPDHYEEKQGVRIPRIKSMDDYIEHHYTQELMRGMLEDITTNWSRAIVLNTAANAVNLYKSHRGIDRVFSAQMPVV